MESGNRITCDMCNTEIPSASEYKVMHLTPEVAAIFLAEADSIELPVIFTEESNDTIRFDVCMDCFTIMGIKT